MARTQRFYGQGDRSYDGGGFFAFLDHGVYSRAAPLWISHATMKAPFRLVDGTDAADLDGFLASFSAAHAPFRQKMKVARLERFFRDRVGWSLFQKWINSVIEIVEAFERFRAPLTREEFERRNPQKLSPSQLQNLERDGATPMFLTTSASI